MPDQDGVRSAPITVMSEATAREEASRRSHERAMDRYVAHPQASPTARLIHQDVVLELGLLAQR